MALKEKITKTYWKNITLGFVIEATGEALLEMKDEQSSIVNTLTVDGNEAKVLIGTVINDPKEIWGIGYKSDFWAKPVFKPTSKYLVEVDTDAKMWLVDDLETGTTHEGGYYTTSSDEMRSLVVIIEWDTEKPENADFIESLIEAYI